MPDEEVHLHPSRPPTEAEHRFAMAIVDGLKFLGETAVIVAFIAGIAAFAWGTWVLIYGKVGSDSIWDLLSLLCSGWAVLWIGFIVLALILTMVEWVRWASGTKPARREHDGDWRDFEL